MAIGRVAKVEAIGRPSKSMKDQSPIPLLLAKPANKNNLDNATCLGLGRPIPLFWMVLCSSIGMLLVPFFWMIKLSGGLHERKKELMILNSNGDENGASAVKGGALCCGKSGQGCSFNARG